MHVDLTTTQLSINGATQPTSCCMQFRGIFVYEYYHLMMNTTILYNSIWHINIPSKINQIIYNIVSELKLKNNNVSLKLELLETALFTFESSGSIVVQNSQAYNWCEMCPKICTQSHFVAILYSDMVKCRSYKEVVKHIIRTCI